jgi:hypothetical protein
MMCVISEGSPPQDFRAEWAAAVESFTPLVEGVNGLGAVIWIKGRMKGG